MVRRAILTLTIMCLWVLFAPARARAQAFELNGGYSTMFEAQGASVSVQAGDSQGWLGGGFVQGRFKLGAYGQTLFRGLTIGAGDDATEFKLPTDLFTGGQYVFRRGVSAAYGSGRDKISIFGGTSSQAFGAPYFRAAEADTPLGMISVDHQVSPGLHLFSRNLFSGTQTSINGVEWQTWSWLRTALAVGIGGNQPYLSSNFDAHWERLEVKTIFASAGERFRRVVVPAPHMSEVNGPGIEVDYKPFNALELSAGHLEFLQPTDAQQPAITAKVNRASVGASVRGFRVGAGAFQTQVGDASGAAQNLYVSRALGHRIEATANLYHTGTATATSNTQSFTFRESLHPRLKLLQMISHTKGQTSFSYGGEFISNLARVSVDYQNVYLPFDLVKPLRQAVSVNAEFHLIHGTGLQLSSFMDSTGKVRYTISAKQFLYHGPGQRMMSPAAQVKFGKYVVRGHVVDESGHRISGAAVYIGDQLAITDTEGRFFVRFTRGLIQPVRVATDEFLQSGYWQVVKAPPTALPQPEDEAKELEIIVRHLTPQAKRLRDSQSTDANSTNSGNIDNPIHRY